MAESKQQIINRLRTEVSKEKARGDKYSYKAKKLEKVVNEIYENIKKLIEEILEGGDR